MTRDQYRDSTLIDCPVAILQRRQEVQWETIGVSLDPSEIEMELAREPERYPAPMRDLTWRIIHAPAGGTLRQIIEQTLV